MTNYYTYCSYMFRHYCIILRDLVESTLLIYTSLLVHLLVIPLTTALTYLCNLARYFLQAHRGWHNIVETYRSSITICQLIVYQLISVQNKKNQINVCLPGLCYRFHSDTFLLALPFHGGTKLSENIIQDLAPNWIIDCLEVYN